MKIYIIQDGEGVACVNQWPEKTKPERLREANILMTKEVNAAVEGALAAGADEVYVQESHPFVLELLHEDIKLVQGGSVLDETFDAQFFVGQHAMAMAENGMLAHTFCHTGVKQMLLNGVAIGEIGWRTIIAGSMGVPTVLVTGDEAACCEALRMQKNIITVPVKKGSGLHSGVSLSPAKARMLIREKASEAVAGVMAGEFEPYYPSGPYELIIEYYNPLVAEKAMIYPGIESVSAVSVKYHADSFNKLVKFRQFSALIHGIGF
jgi:D-amino peptidase